MVRWRWVLRSWWLTLLVTALERVSISVKALDLTEMQIRLTKSKYIIDTWMVHAASNLHLRPVLPSSVEFVIFYSILQRKAKCGGCLLLPSCRLTSLVLSIH